MNIHMVKELEIRDMYIAELRKEVGELRAKLGKLESLAKVAKKFVRTFSHAEDCDIEFKHDDGESECTCGYSWFEDALQKLKETK